MNKISGIIYESAKAEPFSTTDLAFANELAMIEEDLASIKEMDQAIVYTAEMVPVIACHEADGSRILCVEAENLVKLMEGADLEIGELEDAIRSGTLQASELMINLSKLIEKRFGNVEIEPSLFRMAGQMSANIFDILSTIAMNDSILKFFSLLNSSLEGITTTIKALAPAISKLLVVFGSLFLLSKSLSILVAIPSFIGGHIFGLLGNLKTSFMTMGAYFKNQESIKYMNMLNSGLITPDMMPRKFMKGKLGKTLMYTGVGGIALMGVGSFLSSKSKEGTVVGDILRRLARFLQNTLISSR